MPLILAATDFSDVAKNAVNYACGIAQAQKAEVMIIHSFIVPVMFSDIPMPVSLMNDAQKEAEEMMAKLADDLTLQYPGVNVEGRVIYGDTINVIEEYSEENKRPWLVVVGNSSAGENNAWPDSVLIDVFKRLKFPVLAVPLGSKFDNIEKICLAFDNKNSGNNIALNQLTDITNLFNVELHVINAQPDVHNQDSSTDINTYAKNILDKVNAHYHFVYEASNINKIIEDFVAGNNMDWLVMIPRKHSFFEGLFHRSHTKSVAHTSNIPILVLHESE